MNIFDPRSIYLEKIDSLKKKFDGIEVVTTSPASEIMEMNSHLFVSSLMKFENLFFKQYPSLSNDMKDLYPHISSMDIDKVLAKPGYAELNILVNKEILRESGVKENSRSITVIPNGTTFEVDGLIFTLDHDIRVSVSDHNVVVEQLINDMTNDNAVGIIRSDIITVNELEWISFTVKVKQVLVKKETISLITNGIIDETYEYNGKLSKVIAYREVDSERIPVKLSLDDAYLEPGVETLFLKIENGSFNIQSPSINILNSNYDGVYVIEYHLTEGNINTDLSAYPTSAWNIDIGLTDSVYKETIQDIPIGVLSESVVYGGFNGHSFEDLKDIVINNIRKFESLNGVSNRPITKFELINICKENNLYLSKLMDTTKSKIFSVDGTPDTVTQYADTRPYIENGVVKLSFKDNYYKGINVIRDKLIIHDMIVKTENGITRPISITEFNRLTNLSKDGLNSYINQVTMNKNIYTYNIKLNDSFTTDIEVVNVKPKVLGYTILEKDKQDINIDIDIVDIKLIDKKFRLVFSINSTEEIDNIATLLGCQISIRDKQKQRLIKHSNYEDKRFTFDIDTTLYTDDYYIELKDPYGNIPLMYFKDIVDIEVSIYQKSYVNGISSEELEFVPDDVTYKTLTKELVTVKLFDKIDSVCSNMKRIINSDIYERYEEDVYLTYGYDITLGMNGIDGKIIEKYRDILEVNPTEVINRGDFVLDKDGNRIKIHNQGDIKLDENGNPIILGTDLIEFQLEVPMVKYLPSHISKDITDSYNHLLKLIDFIVMSQIPEINASMLENTSLCYKSRRYIGPIDIIADGNVMVIEYLTPKIEIITDNLTFSDIYSDKILKRNIGLYIDDVLNNEVVKVAEIEEGIRNMFKEITGVRVILNNNDNRVFKTINNKRMKLKTDIVDNRLVYDIDINIKLT